MNFSHRHIFMLATISIFTGMIAPAVTLGNTAYPYSLTNMQYVTYGILFGIIVLLVFALLGWKRFSYLITAMLILLIASLGIMTIVGMVKNFSGDVLQGISWGWIFLCIGLFFLFLTLIKEDRERKDSDDDLMQWYEKILAITSIVVFLILSGFVIMIAEKNAEKWLQNSIIDTIFNKDAVHTGSLVLSPAFQNISHFSYHRAKKQFSFLWTDFSGKTTVYPDNLSLPDPENVTAVVYLAGRTFLIQKDGNVIENWQKIGHTDMQNINAQSDFIAFYDNDGKLHTITEMYSHVFHPPTQTASLFTYHPHTHDVYWRETIDGKQQIFKNGQSISEAYASILRYVVSEDDSIIMIIQWANDQKFVVKNNTITHAISPEYVSGTLRMNSSDVLYVVKNSEDDSFSVVMNGVKQERKLEEIREIFIEQNASGFSYFGRPQGEKKYCLFTRYRGNLCAIEAYMNPGLEGDNSTVVFAGLRDGKLSIYRNTVAFIRNIGYMPHVDISFDYFLFDKTNVRHYLFVRKEENGYTLNKMGKLQATVWEDVNIEGISFDYEKVFIPVKNANEWRILEL